MNDQRKLCIIPLIAIIALVLVVLISTIGIIVIHSTNQNESQGNSNQDIAKKSSKR